MAALAATLLAFPGAIGYRQNGTAAADPAPTAVPYEKDGQVSSQAEVEIHRVELASSGPAKAQAQTILYAGVRPRQTCPGMVGPLHDRQYYCTSKEHGLCDRRSGTCFCSAGYEGRDCAACAPTHFAAGSLCYPKVQCPKGCSGNGACDQTTGSCTCNPYRVGEDCAGLKCQALFDERCEECTRTGCVRCVQGYSVDPGAAQGQPACRSCARFDPRCTHCSTTECLSCADTLLNSVRRSGKRRADPELPVEEAARPLTIDLPFGSKDPDFFRDAEPYELLEHALDPPRACHQGIRGNWTWQCTQLPELEYSHRVCGHRGVVGFSSPTYVVSESEDAIRITVERSGGGAGEAKVSYSLVHETTGDSDVSATARYTSSQHLTFRPGEISKSFLVQVHEDNELEGDETFLLVLAPYFSTTDDDEAVFGDPLNAPHARGVGAARAAGGRSQSRPAAPGRRPKGSIGGAKAVLGAQSVARVTILDNDAHRTSADLSQATGAALGAAVAGTRASFTVQTISNAGEGRAVPSDGIFLVEVVVHDTMHAIGDPAAPTVAAIARGSVSDEGNGVLRCAYEPVVSGTNELSVLRATQGGLMGTYFDDSFLHVAAFSRVDRQINFDWGSGRVTKMGTDFVSVQWDGRIKAPASGTYRFYVTADDHVRLAIDDRVLLDRWDRIARESSALVSLKEDTYHRLLIQYRDVAGPADVKLEWEGGDASLPRQVVPDEALFYVEHVASSPYLVQVSSGATAGRSSECTGRGLYEGIAGVTSKFTLLPRDAHGNRRDDGVCSPRDADRFLVEAVLQRSGAGRIAVPGHLSYNSAGGWWDGAFTPTISGPYRLHVALHTEDGVEHVYGSPFAVAIDPGPIHASTTTFSDLGYDAAEAGVPVVFTITARDQFSNRLRSGGAALTAMIAHESGAGHHFGTVRDNGDGTYTASVVPLRKGTNRVHVTLGDSPVAASGTALVNVAHSVASPSRTMASGAGLVRGTTGLVSTFRVHAFDRFGNQCDAGFSATCSVTRRDETGAVGGASLDGCDCSHDIHDGRQTCVYTPTAIGKVAVDVRIDGASLAAAPFSVAVVGGGARGTSTATGSALFTATAGVQADALVVAHDEFHNPMRTGGDAFTVAMEMVHPARRVELPGGPDRAARTAMPGSFTDNGDGTYGVHYRVEIAGEYRLHIKASDGSGIVGSPFAVLVLPGEVHSRNSFSSGTGLRHGTAGRPAPVIVQAVDSFGNFLTRGGATFTAALSGPQERMPITVLDRQDGSYTLPYVALRSGTREAPHDGTQNLTVLHHPSSTLRGQFYRSRGLRNWAATVLTDRTTGLAFDWGFAAPSLRLAGPDAGKHQRGGVERPESATFPMDFWSAEWDGFLVPPVSEEFTFYASTDLNSHVVVEINGEKLIDDLGAAVIRQERAAQLYLPAGTMIPLSIQYHHGQGHASIRLEWSSATVPRSRVPASALYHPGELVSGRSYAPEIFPNTVDAAVSTFRGEECLGHATTTAPCVLTLEARDAHGNQLRRGGLMAAVLAHGPGRSDIFRAKIVDNMDGTYTAAVDIPVAGRYSLRATIGAGPQYADAGPTSYDAAVVGGQLRDSPVAVLVSAGAPVASESLAEGRGLATAVAGTTTNFTVLVRDLHGNPVHSPSTDVRLVATRATTSLRHPIFDGSVSDVGGFTKAIAHAGGGRFLVSYTVNAAAAYHMHVGVAGEAILGSPFRLAVLPNQPAAETTTASGPVLDIAYLHARSSFFITARDEFGNRLDRGGAHFVVTQRGDPRGAARAQVEDLGDGTYIASFTATKLGAGEIDVMLARRSEFDGDPGGGGGLSAAYFETFDFKGAPSLERIDGPVDASFGAPREAGVLPAKYYSVRWTGYLKAPASIAFTFDIRSPGRARLYIDHKLIIDTDENPIGEPHEMLRGHLHRITIEYEEDSGAGTLQLFWAGGHIQRQLVPSFYLFPSALHISGSPFACTVLAA